MLIPIIAISLSGLFGCNSELSIDDMASEDVYEVVEPGPTIMRRLTRAQYDNTIYDLFGSDIVIPTISEADSMKGGFLSVGASTSSYTPRGVESIESASYGIAGQVVSDDTLLNSLLPCSASGPSDEDCAGQFVEAMGKRLWRRDLNEEEIQTYRSIVLEAAAVYDDFNRGIEFALAGMLQSPNFLYRIELGEDDPDHPGQRRFTNNELAHRLSFFLWNSIPDDALLAAAEDGSIATREGLFSQAKRMLEDDKAKLGVSNFFSE
ncbi:MAG: DUF1595 domain-containing protein, partial [Myxococcota bacterium]|nr:DUF1595 domain-containing protein [Myxococcota bacterium]